MLQKVINPNNRRSLSPVHKLIIRDSVYEIFLFVGSSLRSHNVKGKRLLHWCSIAFGIILVIWKLYGLIVMTMNAVMLQYIQKVTLYLYC